MAGIWDKIDKIGWKKEVEKCFKKNHPDRCPRNSFELIESFDPKGKTIHYCKYYSYCSRVHRFRK